MSEAHTFSSSSRFSEKSYLLKEHQRHPWRLMVHSKSVAHGFDGLWLLLEFDLWMQQCRTWKNPLVAYSIWSYPMPGLVPLIKWTLQTPNEDTKTILKSISQRLIADSNNNIYLRLSTFEMVKYRSKEGKLATKLKPVPKESFMPFIVAFVSQILPKIITLQCKVFG